ncbi:MAG: hypothetical protein AAF922_07635 [Pseudomonadota bacterium]
MSSQPTARSESRSGAQVARRRVFYVPGFDPIPPRRYRELYRKEAAEQAALSGYEIALTPAQREGGRFGWGVEARIGTQQTITEIDVLVWSDIVRRSMGSGIASTYAQLVRTAWIYISSGALARLVRLRKGPVLAAFYPVVFLLGQLALAVFLGLLAAKLINWLGRVWNSDLLAILAALCALVTAVLVLRWFRARDGRFYAYYLMHDYAFSAQYHGAYPPMLEKRLADFEKAISQALDQQFDEVLVVGHSSGAHLAASALADVLRARTGVVAEGPRLSFLSLGQVVPMQSFLPRADRLRADLAYLADSDALTWVDVSAPGDGCSFALCDPVAVSGVADADKLWPLVLSAAFTQTLSPARWKALRWRFFRLHFQYLCAFDRPGAYDYFQITAGPMTLAQRFEDRAPSPSRIERPLSGYTSRASI